MCGLELGEDALDRAVLVWDGGQEDGFDRHELLVETLEGEELGHLVGWEESFGAAVEGGECHAEGVYTVLKLVAGNEGDGVAEGGEAGGDAAHLLHVSERGHGGHDDGGAGAGVQASEGEEGGEVGLEGRGAGV